MLCALQAKVQNLMKSDLCFFGNLCTFAETLMLN